MPTEFPRFPRIKKFSLPCFYRTCTKRSEAGRAAACPAFGVQLPLAVAELPAAAVSVPPLFVAELPVDAEMLLAVHAAETKRPSIRVSQLRTSQSNEYSHKDVKIV